jgi:hypothetical protein
VKWIAALAIVACTLMASLYATAAPTSSPQLRALRVKVSKLEGRLILAEGQLKALGCKADFIWDKLWPIYTKQVFPDLVFERPTFAPRSLPACIN